MSERVAQEQLEQAAAAASALEAQLIDEVDSQRTKHSHVLSDHALQLTVERQRTAAEKARHAELEQELQRVHAQLLEAAATTTTTTTTTPSPPPLLLDQARSSAGDAAVSYCLLRSVSI